MGENVDSGCFSRQCCVGQWKEVALASKMNRRSVKVSFSDRESVVLQSVKRNCDKAIVVESAKRFGNATHKPD